MHTFHHIQAQRKVTEKIMLEKKSKFKLRMVTLNVDLKWVWWPASVHKNLQEIENAGNDKTTSVCLF